ncbi:MAG: undecaprenyl/decaprenyl-phosphate alpha-N-acetylglucosaminyl 1-phosphate transferase [Firmicutes bacterium]|nr:undecaprenyl/decaprenyl-phosphate alpha-N-acetylglucosaminyl 1-phosphate transferase [Bacillota bacterium]
MQIAFSMVAALITALLVTPLAIRLAHKYHIVDQPNARKVHQTPTPRMGGVAIYAGFVVGVLLSGCYTRPVAALLVSSTLVMLTGLVDDIRGISPKVKLLGQIVASLVFCLGSSGVQFITNPLNGGLIDLGFWGIPVTVLWLTGVSNAVNLIDGLDGLSAGVSAIAALCMAAVCLAQGNAPAAIAAVILVCAAAGFLRYNFHPAKTFMGDCGSLFLGFVLGAIAIMGLSKGATVVSLFIPFIIMGIPIFDTLFSILRRMFLHKPIFQADKGHLHHSLLSLGLSHRQTVLAIYAISLVMGLSAVLMAVLTSSQAVVILILVTIGIFAGGEKLGVLRGKKLVLPEKQIPQKTR